MYRGHNPNIPVIQVGRPDGCIKSIGCCEAMVHVLQMTCLFHYTSRKTCISFDDVDISILPSLIVPATWMIDLFF